MGFFKDAAQIVGNVAAIAIAAPIEVVGEITNSKFIKEVAEGAFYATANTGKIVGEIAEGTAKCAAGVIQQDSKKAGEGLGEVMQTSAKTVVGIGKGVAKTVGNGIDTISAIAEGDMDKAINTGKEMLKVAAIGAVAIGVGDIVGGIDADNDGVPDFLEHNDANGIHASGGGNPNGGTGPSFVYEDEPPTYWVNAPHTQNGGYWRTMPDATTSNNLSS